MPPGDKADDHLLDALKGELEHSYRIAERVDGKAQRLIAFAGAFFALVQAAAISNLLRSLERHDRIVLLASALAALGALFMAALAAVNQERPLEVGQLPLRRINQLIVQAYGKDDVPTTELTSVSRELTKVYASLVQDVRDFTLKRNARYIFTQYACGLSIVLTSAELGWALAARLS